jgi:hypothetical protein
MLDVSVELNEDALRVLFANLRGKNRFETLTSPEVLHGSIE